ncbi:unnamed protein product [Linum trigynum]|uniref:Uncharacterized protein n=1 Tax=Linum trigynum TaxID=586398 RepID=A0AAV2DI70_9ROSI
MVALVGCRIPSNSKSLHTADRFKTRRQGARDRWATRLSSPAMGFQPVRNHRKKKERNSSRSRMLEKQLRISGLGERQRRRIGGIAVLRRARGG